MRGLGRHLVIDLYQVSPSVLKDSEFLLKLLERAASESGATIIKSFAHRFSLQGVSCVVVIGESHVTIHTWPEKNYAALDFFSCSSLIDLDKAIRIILTGLNTQTCQITSIERGISY